jgi:hypothetical protein
VYENILFLLIGRRLFIERSGGTPPLRMKNKTEIRLVAFF